jgi:uncharacterized membrane protein YdbT with pleckstrin-like domain
VAATVVVVVVVVVIVVVIIIIIIIAVFGCWIAISLSQYIKSNAMSSPRQLQRIRGNAEGGATWLKSHLRMRTASTL